MAKKFKDFTYNGKKLSDVGQFISVDFTGNSGVNLAMQRTMDGGTTNNYRIEPNYYGDSWSGTLSFELHIMKDVCMYDSQEELRFTKTEIRDFTRWLTSPHFTQWIQFEYEDNADTDEVSWYKGYFSNIQAWTISGEVMGLQLSFICTTAFGYTDTMVHDIECNVDGVIHNVRVDGDDLEDYTYPFVRISPKSTGEFLLCNISDTDSIYQKELDAVSTEDMISFIEDIAHISNYEIQYLNADPTEPKFICNDKAVQFYYTDRYGVITKYTCFYYYDENAEKYEMYITQNNVMYMDLSEGLEVCMDCQHLLLYDALGRPITYDRLNIQDVDFMYWLRLLHGNNQLLCIGDVDLQISYREVRKVGE